MPHTTLHTHTHYVTHGSYLLVLYVHHLPLHTRIVTPAARTHCPYTAGSFAFAVTMRLPHCHITTGLRFGYRGYLPLPVLCRSGSRFGYAFLVYGYIHYHRLRFVHHHAHAPHGCCRCYGLLRLPCITVTLPLYVTRLPHAAPRFLPVAVLDCGWIAVTVPGLPAGCGCPHCYVLLHVLLLVPVALPALHTHTLPTCRSGLHSSGYTVGYGCYRLRTRFYWFGCGCLRSVAVCLLLVCGYLRLRIACTLLPRFAVARMRYVRTCTRCVRHFVHTLYGSHGSPPPTHAFTLVTLPRAAAHTLFVTLDYLQFAVGLCSTAVMQLPHLRYRHRHVLRSPFSYHTAVVTLLLHTPRTVRRCLRFRLPCRVTTLHCLLRLFTVTRSRSVAALPHHGSGLQFACLGLRFCVTAAVRLPHCPTRPVCLGLRIRTLRVRFPVVLVYTGSRLCGSDCPVHYVLPFCRLHLTRFTHATQVLTVCLVLPVLWLRFALHGSRARRTHRTHLCLRLLPHLPAVPGWLVITCYTYTHYHRVPGLRLHGCATTTHVAVTTHYTTVVTLPAYVRLYICHAYGYLAGYLVAGCYSTLRTRGYGSAVRYGCYLRSHHAPCHCCVYTRTPLPPHTYPYTVVGLRLHTRGCLRIATTAPAVLRWIPFGYYRHTPFHVAAIYRVPTTHTQFTHTRVYWVGYTHLHGLPVARTLGHL